MLVDFVDNLDNLLRINFLNKYKKVENRVCTMFVELLKRWWGEISTNARFNQQCYQQVFNSKKGLNVDK